MTKFGVFSPEISNVIPEIQNDTPDAKNVKSLSIFVAKATMILNIFTF